MGFVGIVGEDSRRDLFVAARAEEAVLPHEVFQVDVECAKGGIESCVQRHYEGIQRYARHFNCATDPCAAGTATTVILARAVVVVYNYSDS